MAQQRFEQLASEIKALPATMSATEFHGLRERIEDVIKFSMGAGGRAYDVAAATYQIREALIAAMRQSCAGDERTLAGIEQADELNKEYLRRFYVPVLAQLRRERSPIEKEDWISTILSEDASAIAIFMSLLSEDGRSLFRDQALSKMKDVLDSGYRDPKLEEKILALDVGTG